MPNTQLTSNTKQLQSQVATLCRVGESERIEGTNPERLKLYRELTFNLFEEALDKAYPLTHKALGEDLWLEFVHRFLAEFPASSPFVWRMPHGVLEWFATSCFKERAPEYLAELLDFEWLEVELYAMEDRAVDYTPNGHLLEDPIVLNPEHVLRCYQYPVFNTSPEELVDKKGQYFVLCYRHPVDLDVRFFELSPFFAAILEVLKQEPMSAAEAIELVGEHFKISVQERKKAQGFFKELREQGLLLGFCP